MESENLNTQTCLNCAHSNSGKYCSNCGQSADVSRITVKETVNHFFSSSFSIEGPFIKTVSDLVRNPGLLHREYISGQRKKYYKPVALFVLSTAIYVVIRALIGYDPLAGELQELDAKSNTEAANLMKETARFMVTNINNILFLLVFSLATMFKLFYRKRYNFAEYLSVGFFLSSFYILFGIFNMLFSHYTGIKTSNFQLLFLLGYTFYTAFSLFKSSNLMDVLKYLLISGFSLLLYVFMGFGFSFLIIHYF